MHYQLMVSNGFYHGLAVLQPDAHSRMVIIGREKAEVSSARRLEAAERSTQTDDVDAGTRVVHG